MSENKKFKGHVISHTHWDRAWYWAFQKYRIRLVNIVDQLIDILQNDPKYVSFTFDGHSAVLEDYLEVKPEKRSVLEELVSKKKIYVGPWYVLPDEFIVSAESLVRNLLIGSDIASKFGNVLMEGYVPDPFGHIAQLPQILNGFGIKSFIFSRGYPFDAEEFGTEFKWLGLDDSEVLAVFMRNSYGNFSALGYEKIWGNFSKIKPDNDIAMDRLNKEFNVLSKDANTDVLLFCNGCDHMPPQKELPELIDYLNNNQGDVELIHSNFPDFIKSLNESGKDFKKYKGELLGSKYACILLSVSSTRMYLKQMNYFSQNLFEKYVEPISTFNSILGGYYYQPIINTGWKIILKNHPHDDICGTGVDEIHRQMVSRYEQANQVGEYIVNYAFNELGNNINTNSIENAKPIVIFNPHNWNVTDLLYIDVLLDPRDELTKGFIIVDNEGNEIEYEIISNEKYNVVEILEEVTYQKIRIKMVIRDVPCVGYKTIYLLRGEKKRPIFKHKTTNKNKIENDFFEVIVKNNGSLDIIDKNTKRVYEGLNLFEDTEDAGDEYTYSYAKESKTITSFNFKASVKINRTSIGSEVKINLNMKLPESLNDLETKRSNKTKNLPIETIVNLYNGVRRIDIKTKINNNVKDHRFRALFPSGISSNKCLADGHFAFIEREISDSKKPSFKNKFEYYATRNQQKFVSVSNNKYGLTISNKGLPEYEIVKSHSKLIIALTLVRSVGELSRSNLITRPGNGGPMLKTPEAQCQGEMEFEYSIIPHEFDVEKSKVYKEAYQFNTSLLAFNVNKNDKGFLKDTQKLIDIDSDIILISSIKNSKADNKMLIRLYNPTDKKCSTKITLFKKFKKAFLADLKEDYILEIDSENNEHLFLEFSPYKFLSIILEF
jgi:mannosylglycerate hydrolase